MEYTVENLEKAVLLFYRTEAVQQAEAHQWLQEAQNSQQAWSFVWELLHPQRSPEVQFFAATTLHTKILKYWSEVPEDHYEVLKKKILEAIINYASGPKIVLNRLCITLSAYIIHTIPIHWPNAFEELVSSFQPHHLPNVEPERVIWILLEILTVIPEEFQSTLLLSSQRNRVKNVLLQVSKDILKVVEMCLTPLPSTGYDMSNLTTYLNAARCAVAWIQLGGLNIDECSRFMDILIDLTCFIYWNKEDPEGLSSDELEVIEVSLEALTTIVNHPNTYKYKNYVLKLTESILRNFTKILQVENKNSEPNKDVLATFYSLIVTIADSHSKLFIDLLLKKEKAEQQLALDLLHCLLECANTKGVYPTEETSSSICFGFWYTLQDDILSLDAAECAELLLAVKPFYRQLLCVMVKKSMYPDYTKGSLWSLDDKEVFRCYRQDVADTYMYCYNVLNLEMLDILNNKLNEALTECITNPGRWNYVESCLHAFSAVAECIELENLYLPKLMETLKGIPYNNLSVKVLASALDCAAAYSEWLTEHPHLLDNIIPLVVNGIGNPDISPNATMALKDLSHNCQQMLQPYAEHIVQACELALRSDALKLAEQIRIMYSLGKILGVLPVERIKDHLTLLLGPLFEEIEKLLQTTNNLGVTTNLVTKLKIISALFGTLHIQDDNSCEQPLLLVVKHTMHIYEWIGKQYTGNTEVWDVLCGLFKHVITTLMDGCKPIISEILELIASSYKVAPQASILILAKTILIMFANDQQIQLQSFMHEIANTTIRMFIQLHATNQMSEKSDVIEAFYSMLAHLHKKTPILLQTSHLDMVSIFQFAVISLELPEIHTMKVVTSFLVNFISQSRDNGHSEIVENYGDALVMRVLLNIGGTASRTCIEVLSDILLVLNKKYCVNLANWLQVLLQKEGFPSPKVSSKQKEHFIKAVLKEKAVKRKLLDSTVEFGLLCRGILSVDPSTVI